MVRVVSSVEDTYWDRVSCLSREVNILFLGFLSRHKDKSKTKCKFYCNTCGRYWETTNIVNFLSRKRNPCKVCSKKETTSRLTTPEDTYLPQVIESCERYNTEFLGWSGEYRGVQSVIRHRCRIHDVITERTHSRSLVENKNTTSGCSLCFNDHFRSLAETRYKNHIEEFLKTGSYVEGTLFTKSEKVTKEGVRNYWEVYCPTCGEDNTVFIGSLKNGSVSCSCYTHEDGYFPKHKLRDDELYLLLFTTKLGCEYVKIGRSFDTRRRISNMRNPSECEIRVLSKKKGKHREIFELEQKLHSVCYMFHYTPEVMFSGGKKECFSLDCLEVTEVKEIFNL